MMNASVIGGLGLMASPMAIHLKNKKSLITIHGVHDRGKKDERRNQCRLQWQQYGARLLPTIKETLAVENLDGVFVCCGKNGDDAPLIHEITKELSGRKKCRPFICHMSTVSAGFVEAADKACRGKGVDYINYPLTGGSIGAQKASMLILASGNKSVFEKIEPVLRLLGKPRYFGERASAASQVKLIGHLMVFNGLMGITSAIAVHSECFNNGKWGGKEQVDFFDFLNTGAGGTRQWDVICKTAVANDQWLEPFSLKYAAIDAIYAAKLCIDSKVSQLVSLSIAQIALAFIYVMRQHGSEISTQGILREFVAANRDKIDAFVLGHTKNFSCLNSLLDQCVTALPEALQSSVLLNVDFAEF